MKQILQSLKTGATEVADVPCPSVGHGKVLIGTTRTLVRYFAANNVTGAFEQGDAYSNGVGDFVQLRAWLVSHLMWNPQQDEKQLTGDFLRGYYGAAAPHLQAYLDLIQDAFLRSGLRLSTFQRNHSYLTPEVMDQATRHFRDAAQAVAGDPVRARRVRRERLPLDHVWLVHYEMNWRAAQAAGTPFEGPRDAVAAVVEFVRTAEEFGAENYMEGETFASYASKLLQLNLPVLP